MIRTLTLPASFSRICPRPFPAPVGDFGKIRVAGTIAKFIVILTLLLSSCAATALAQAQRKNVLILYDENTDFPGLILLDQSLTSSLRAGTTGQLDIYKEYMDLSRFSAESHRKRLRDAYQQKYQDKKIDVIFAVMGPSLDFMLEYGSQLFPGTPIVFAGIDKRELAGRNLSPNVTGVLVKRVFKPTLELALRIQPDTRQVVFIRGASDFSKYWGEQAREELREFEGRLTITDLSSLSMNDIRQEVARLPPHTIILYLHMFRDSAGSSFHPNQALSLIAEKANVPIYVFLDQFIGKGAVGGHVYSMEAQGAKAGELGLRILGGESPAGIPVRDEGTNVDMFDWRELRRWNIPEEQLPAGSIVRFKELTFWEQYKWRIVGVISLCVLEALLIVGLLINRARRRQAEKDNERLAQVAEADRRRLDEVVSNVPGIVWEVRSEPGSALRKAVFVSEYVEKLLGYSVEEWLSTPGFAFSIIPEEDRERAKREAQDLFESGKGGVLQFRWVTKDGRTIWVESQYAPILDETGETIGLRGVTMDITDRMRAAEALRESEHRFQLVSQATKDILYEWNLETGFVWWNDSAMASVFGYPHEEMRHDFTWWADRLHPEDKDRIGVSVSETLRGVEQMWENEYRFRKMDNSYAHVYHRAFIIRDEGGQALKVIGSLMDFSERKQSEEKLRSVLEEVNRLKNQLQEENIYLREEIKLAHNVDEIIGRSNAIKYVLFKIEQVSKTDSTVLILGETGTGKELVARAIHSQSPRKDRPLVKVNCAALSANLIESELFGHEKGSFTGASARKLGRFELADGATLFLDEIGELPLDLQSKLLRVLQEGEFERLGGTKTVKADVRIIAATNRNMSSEVEKGTFREDLWYRLNVFPITVPPLRQRKDDVPPMVEHFISNFSRKVGKDITAVSSATLKKLQSYSWPGNVRELANVIERAVINAQGPVLHIADRFEEAPAPQLAGASKTLNEIEKEYITRILDDTAWRIEGPHGAAKILGLNPSTLRTRMVKLGIQKGNTATSAGHGAAY